MPIPYRDVDDVEELGLAAYLRIVAADDKSGYAGALFVINARGEPFEFTYNRIETPHTFLWRQDDVRRHATRKLTASILSLCPKTPRLILCLAEEVRSELFCQDIQVSIPVCRLAPAIEVTSYSGDESQDTLKDPEPMNLFWFPNRPQENSIEIRLLQELISRGLLIEPFERVSISTTNSISAEWSLTPAMNLFTCGAAPFDTQNGSVDLSGVLLNYDVGASSKHPIATHISIDSSKIKPLPTKSEIPLSKRLAYLLQPSTDMLLSKSGPLEWPGTLFEYQIEGIKALTTHDALLLADDMGLGKTIQAVGALRILFLQRYIESCLLIVPAGLISQWRKELHLWAPELRISTIKGPPGERAWQWRSPAHIHITSYETLRSDFTDNPQSPPRRHIWDVVILDEAQKIKNRDVEVSRKCKQLRRRRAWALTGTPIENRIDDLVSILEFVTPLKDGEAPLRLTHGPELIERHKSLQLRRKKSDVLPQLPPKIVSQIVLQLDVQQRESYERAEKEGAMQLQEKGQTARIENVLELIMRLKQICNFCPTTGQSVKLEDIYERLGTLESEGHRALIFSQFTDQKYGARAIVSKLQPLQPLLYTGDLSPSQRDATIIKFRENPEHRVLVLSLRAGGQGLNLQDASYVFHFDRWWNPAVERQAEGRSHRLGQTFPVNVYKYICEGTIEERIDKILQGKQHLFDEIVDDVSIDLKSKLTSEELFGLFGLTPPEKTKSSHDATMT